MRASVGAAWRAAAAVAFAATAALAVTVTRAPPHTTLASSHDAAAVGADAGARHLLGGPPRCAPARLDVSIENPGAAAARMVASHAVLRFPVEFTNISGSACTLSGFPQVSAYGPGDTLVGKEAALDTSVSVLRVVLAPGATAHAAVVASVSGGRCQPVTVTGLRVVPPGQTVPRYVRHPMTACSAAGRTAPVFFHVRAVQPGTGMPAGAKTRHPDQRRQVRQASKHAGRPAG